MNDYFKKLSKKDLENIINDYNKLSNLFKYEKITIKGNKKDIINEVLSIKDNYIQGIIMLLDNEDYTNLKRHTINKELKDYLNSKYIYLDKVNINDYLKNKVIKKNIKYSSNIYTLVNGFIIAYGVVDINYIDKLNIININNLITMLDFYYKKNYLIKDNYLISKYLKNKNKINKYKRDNNYKEFTYKEYLNLGKEVYHHNIKYYKKYIKILKSYYVFKNSDIEFIDINIVIPYLYNNINDEEKALEKIKETISKLFEFKNDRLKDKMIKEIIQIKDYFPLWENRGFSKKERNML